jgi:2-oxoisovalerate dehydrogenase E2 component (dihydrolipoyl transacylase)
MGQYSFKLPDIGEGTAEAEIAEWRVKVGDNVEEDQPLVDMMTDKATVELTSPVAGIVRSVAGQAGQMAAVGSVLVVLETESPHPVPPPADGGGDKHTPPPPPGGGGGLGGGPRRGGRRTGGFYYSSLQGRICPTRPCSGIPGRAPQG